jgi:beta propeller repeat protein
MGIFTALFLLLVNVALAAAAPVPASISISAERQGRPDIHGNVVVWKRLMALNSPEWDIYSYNLLTGSESVVTSDPGSQINPMTNGFVVIWEDWRTGQGDIYMKDLFLGIEQPLVTGAGNQGVLGISGNTVVYVDDHNGNNDVKAVDLTSRAIQPVCTTAADQWQPRVSGTKVVWQDNRYGNYDIFMKDLSSGIERQLTTDPGDDTSADISGDVVVWKSHRGSQYDIRWMNLNDGIDRAVTNDPAYQWSASVSGDLVTWMDHRNDPNPSGTDYDIYMKDLTSGVESMLAGGSIIQGYPRIDRDKVVWEENGNGNFGIWMATIPDSTPPSISNMTPTGGARAGCGSTPIAASFSDNRIGVDSGSVRLTLDGRDVTAGSTVTNQSVSYQSDALTTGQHSVSLTVADLAGNTANSTWQFYASPASPRLDARATYWDGYSDYISRQLSVTYEISNIYTDYSFFDVQIVAATSNAGVTLSSPMPVIVGDISPGDKKDFVLKYVVPENINSFKSDIYASVRDACNGVTYLPGPPPDL